MRDCFDEGYGAAMCGITHWPDVVMGRCLKDWERKGLAAGWLAGLRDRATYAADMATAEANGVSMWEVDGEPVPL